MEPLTDEQRKLAEDNHNLIYKFLKRYGLSVDSYYGQAAIGLCIATKDYDADIGKFSTYAYKCMYTSVYSEMRKQNAEKRTSDKLAISYESSVTYNNGEQQTLLDTLASIDDFEEQIVSHESVLDLIKSLSDKEKQVALMLSAGYTQIDVGKSLGIPQVYVSRMKTKIKNKLQPKLNRIIYN